MQFEDNTLSAGKGTLANFYNCPYLTVVQQLNAFGGRLIWLWPLRFDRSSALQVLFPSLKAWFWRWRTCFLPNDIDAIHPRSNSTNACVANTQSLCRVSSCPDRSLRSPITRTVTPSHESWLWWTAVYHLSQLQILLCHWGRKEYKVIEWNKS